MYILGYIKFYSIAEFHFEIEIKILLLNFLMAGLPPKFCCAVTVKSNTSLLTAGIATPVIISSCTGRGGRLVGNTSGLPPTFPLTEDTRPGVGFADSGLVCKMKCLDLS